MWLGMKMYGGVLREACQDLRLLALLDGKAAAYQHDQDQASTNGHTQWLVKYVR